MFNIIDSLVGTKHLAISLLLTLIAAYLAYNFNYSNLKSLLIKFIFINLFLYYYFLFFYNNFSYKLHLPLHLCYLTELLILISFLFSIKKINSWLLLNSMLGSIVGFVNSNLNANMYFIEYIHYYFSHFNLLLFTILIFKSQLKISSQNTLTISDDW